MADDEGRGPGRVPEGAGMMGVVVGMIVIGGWNGAVMMMVGWRWWVWWFSLVGVRLLGIRVT